MFKVIGQLTKIRPLLHCRQPFKSPIVNATKYPRHEYQPMEREPCPQPKPPPPPKPKNDAALWGTLAFLILAAGFTVFAKNSPETRDWILIQAPWYDDFIAIIYQENMTYREFAKKCIKDLKDIFDKSVEDKPKDCSHEGENLSVVSDSPGDAKSSEPPPPMKTKNICEVVECLQVLGETTMNHYKDATSASAKYNKIVENTMREFDLKNFKELPDRKNERNIEVDKYLANAKESENELLELASTIDKELRGCDDDQKAIESVVNDIQKKIKKEYEKFTWENDISLATDTKCEKVDSVLSNYIEEAEALFPEVKYSENKLQINGDIDLFLHHANRYLKHLREELHETAEAATDKLDRSFDDLPDAEAFLKKRNKLIHANICQKKADLDKEFKRRCHELKCEKEKELTDALADQCERHEETLRRKLPEVEAAANKKLDNMVSTLVAQEKEVLNRQLAALKARLQLLEVKLFGHLKAEREMVRSKDLWSAGASLLAATKRGENYVKVNKELNAIEKASVEDGDQLVTTVLKAIPDSVKDQGVMPESVLLARYNRMEKAALRVALVEEEGGPLHIYLMSLIQYILLFMKMPGIPKEEMDKPPSEPFKDLDTFDLLQRARFWLERGNLAAAIRYVSALEGASRLVAVNWNNAARAHLETRQAAEAILAHATAIGLQYM